MAKKKTVDSVLLRGIRIQKDTIYEVGDKSPNASAPDVYKKLGSEKASSPKGVIANIVGFPFINGTWDTGLYPTSPIFREMGLSPEESEIKSKEYREFLIEPLKKAGLAKLIEKLDEYENEDSTFFLKMQVPLSKGTQFNTGDAKSRLALFTAIISGELAPQGKATKEEKDLNVKDEDDFIYSGAQYTINSQTLVKTTKERREYENNKARGIFFNLMESDKKALTQILNYEGINSSEEDDDYSLNQVISKYFEAYENVSSFLETYEKYKTDDKFKEELDIVTLLLNRKGLKKLQKEGREYYLQGTGLGTSPKLVAKTLARSKQLLNEFYKLVEI